MDIEGHAYSPLPLCRLICMIKYILCLPIALQDELVGVVAAAKPIRSRLGIESTGARSATAAEAARVLPQPLLSAFTLLSAAVHGYGMRATVTVAGMCPVPQSCEA